MGALVDEHHQRLVRVRVRLALGTLLHRGWLVVVVVVVLIDCGDWRLRKVNDDIEYESYGFVVAPNSGSDIDVPHNL